MAYATPAPRRQPYMPVMMTIIHIASAAADVAMLKERDNTAPSTRAFMMPLRRVLRRTPRR